MNYRLIITRRLLIEDSINPPNPNFPLVLNADYESKGGANNDGAEGDGVLTVVSGESISSNGGKLTVTAWDIDLSGTVVRDPQTCNWEFG